MSSSPHSRLIVAHVIQNLNFGGMERVVHSLALGLPDLGFEVHVIVLEYLGTFAEGLDARVRLHEVSPMSKLSLVYPKHLVRLLEAVRPHIVHSHSGVWLKAARAARFANVPWVVHTDHGRPPSTGPVVRLLDRVASRLTDRVVAVSAPLSRQLARESVPNVGKLCIIPNGVTNPVRLSATERREMREQMALPPTSPIIGMVGRLEEVKNVEMALRALALLREQAPQGAMPLLLIVGDGARREALAAKAAELSVAHNVRFLGWRTDTSTVIQLCDLFALTSRSEGTSLSLLEAMVVGVCPTATNVGGTRDALGPDLAEVLVDSGDAPALAALWRSLLGDGQRRLRLGEIAAVRAGEYYLSTRMIGAYADLYRGISGGVTQSATVPALA